MSAELLKTLRDIEDDCLTMNRIDKADAIALAISIIESHERPPNPQKEAVERELAAKKAIRVSADGHILEDEAE